MIDFNDSIFAVQIYGYSLSKTFLRKNGYSFKISLPFILKKVLVRNKTVAYTFALAISKCKVCKVHIKACSHGSPGKTSMLTINSQWIGNTIS